MTELSDHIARRLAGGEDAEQVRAELAPQFTRPTPRAFERQFTEAEEAADGEREVSIRGFGSRRLARSLRDALVDARSAGVSAEDVRRIAAEALDIAYAITVLADPPDHGDPPA
jgi:hypothetical protein